LGGTETYTRELLRALARDGSLDYRVLLPPVAPSAGEGLPAQVAGSYRSAQTIPERLLAMADATARPRGLRRTLLDCDVVHYPLTIRIPRGLEPSVVTLHDLQHLDLPHLFPRSERLFRRAAWEPSLRGATRIITGSTFVRDRAVDRLRLDPDTIRVVPFGVDHATFTPGSGEREPYLIYPARAWPHKNHARLFEAFELLRSERPQLRLVLTGGGTLDAVPEGVEVRGLVSHDELVSLLQRASALVFPSLYEGFGQPTLEAMACGCPVACSDVAALPEIVGGAACLFDPTDVDSIANGIREVLDRPEHWRPLGLARAAQFSWHATARATEAVYRELL
jgi:glycosyltransferase involved in cell wall biosynthesis